MADLCTIRCKSCAFQTFRINNEQPFTDISYIARWRGIILFIENGGCSGKLKILNKTPTFENNKYFIIKIKIFFIYIFYFFYIYVVSAKLMCFISIDISSPSIYNRVVNRWGKSVIAKWFNETKNGNFITLSNELS